jgi:photosystem II stability/assembly factor-like uncharacterized protein
MILKSTDGGRSWESEPRDGRPDGPIKAMAIDPRDSRIGYTSLWNIWYSNALYKTTDGGKTWFEIGDQLGGPVKFAAVSPLNSDVIFCIATRSISIVSVNELYRSTDKGKTWQYVSHGFLNSGHHGLRIEIAFNPVDSMKMYGVGDNSNSGNRFYVSNDGGVTWSDVSFNWGRFILATSDGRVYLDGVNRSDDGGYTWKKFTAGIPTSSFSVWSGTVYHDRLYIVTSIGIYTTDNSEETWRLVDGSDKLPLNDASILVIDEQSGKIYVGTAKGVFAISIPVSVNEYPEGLPRKYELSQNYPNPFNPTKTIKYSLPERAFVHLAVYDVLGREVKTLVQEQQDAGVHSVEFRGDGLPSGVYYYKLTAGTRTLLGKAILIK